MGRLLILISLTLSACGLTKTATEMKDRTDQIGRYTDHLAKRTDDLENELTFKESSAMMLQFMRYLWGEESGPNWVSNAPSDVDTVVYAGATMKSMWFQYWKGDYREDVTSLDERFEFGAEILLARVKAQSDYHHTVDAKMVGPGYKGAGALAAKLDFVRPEFTRALARVGLAPLSFYDVVVMALRERNSMHPQGPFPRAMAKILEYSGEATYLLQLRHNFLPSMVISSISDFKDRTITRLGMQHGKPRAIALNEFNPTQLREWTRWLQLAHQTRDDLRALGLKPEDNSDIRAVRRHLAPRVSATHGETSTLQREFARAFAEAD